MRTWKPGDLAMVTWRGDEYRAVRDTKGWDTLPEGVGFFLDSDVSAVRPLVVIDPEDREQVKRLWGADDIRPPKPEEIDEIQAALRSLIAEPKPEEPTGLGAVVRDDHGLDWHRSATGRWLAEDGLSTKAGGWDHIKAVEILSDGVHP